MSMKITDDLKDLAVVGVDIGKDTFHLVGFDSAGELVLRKKIKRLALNQTFEKFPQCVVGMEACLSAHFVSRTLRGLGFEPRIIPAIYVKPFIKGQKNDYNDAEAIAEAAMRPNLRTVTEKIQDQLDLQAMHRVRSKLVARRTATINQIRAFLIEQGITVRAGRHRFVVDTVSVLRDKAPHYLGSMSDAEAGFLVEDAMLTAEGFGFRSERHIRRFIALETVAG